MAINTTGIEVIHLEHLPQTQKVCVALFRNIQNAAFLHSQLLARNSDFRYAFIDASVIVSRVHVLATVFRSVIATMEGTSTTGNVHSEIIVGLSPNNNIAEAYRRYGITPETKHLVVVKILDISQRDTASGDDIWEHLTSNIQGENVPFSDEELAKTVEWTKVRKYYKLGAISSLNALPTPEAKAHESEQLILGAMALRGVH